MQSIQSFLPDAPCRTAAGLEEKTEMLGRIKLLTVATASFDLELRMPCKTEN